MIDYFPEKPWTCKCGCGFNRINPKLVQMLNIARYHANTAFSITSACRCEEYNKKVGGTILSSHLKGLAVDIRCRNSRKRYKIKRGLSVAGFCRVGTHKDFIHVGIDRGKPQRVDFLY